MRKLPENWEALLEAYTAKVRASFPAKSPSFYVSTGPSAADIVLPPIKEK